MARLVILCYDVMESQQVCYSILHIFNFLILAIQVFQVFRELKGLSPPSEDKTRTYNPEVLTTQKGQWTSFQLQALIGQLIDAYDLPLKGLHEDLNFVDPRIGEAIRNE